LTGSNIGIISPYIAQTRIIRDLITSHPEIRQRIISNLGAGRARELERIEVKTVDGFEGREKQVIVFSTVRNNERGEIGFLADRRRLNVGLTRAKRALFLVGSAKTLAAAKRTSENPVKGADDVWTKYVHWLEKQNLIVVLRGPALRQSMAFGAEPNSAHQSINLRKL
jgi:superfamily I DNA and/or RNA helicase